MYKDEPTGPLTWHWADGPAAEKEVWVGPRLGEECDDWCNATNNPGYADTECAHSINDYCLGMKSGHGTLEEQAFECSRCYLEMTGAVIGSEEKDQCMHNCGGMTEGHIGSTTTWVPWREASQKRGIGTSGMIAPIDADAHDFVSDHQCAYFDTHLQPQHGDDGADGYAWRPEHCDASPVTQAVNTGFESKLPHPSGQEYSRYTTVVEYEALSYTAIGNHTCDVSSQIAEFFVGSVKNCLGYCTAAADCYAVTMRSASSLACNAIDKSEMGAFEICEEKGNECEFFTDGGK